MGQDATGIYVLDQWKDSIEVSYRILEWTNADFTNSGRGLSTVTSSIKDKQ